MLIPAFLLHQCVLNDNLYTEPVKEGRNIIGAYRMSSLFLKYWKLLLLVNILFCAIVISFDLKHLHSENALLENLQGFFLISATAVYFRLAIYSTGDTRLACIGAGMLCFSFFTRELDLELLPLFKEIGFMFHGPGRTLMLLALWSFYIRLVITHGGIGAHIRSVRRAKYLHNFSACFVLLVVGAIFDRGLFLVGYSRLFEELAETNAYLVLALPAFREFYFRYAKG
jgi:hypothetical protein